MTVHRTSNKPPKRQPVSSVDMRPADMKPGMDVLCECGMRYGQHRYADAACMNQEWKPGSGRPQWLSKTFRRAP